MIPYRLEYTIEKISTDFSGNAQKALKKLTGKSLTQNEIRQILSKVEDHKWYVSERLGRDVGFRVAAIDFIENVYRPAISRNKNGHCDFHGTSQPNALFA